MMYMPLMLTATGDADLLSQVLGWLQTVLTWIGAVLDSLISTDGELHAIWPLLGVSIAISALLLGVKIFKSFSWGT